MIFHFLLRSSRDVFPVIVWRHFAMVGSRPVGGSFAHVTLLIRPLRKQSFRLFSSFLSRPQNLVEVSHWYVCVGKPQNRNGSLTFYKTPLPKDEGFDTNFSRRKWPSPIAASRESRMQILAVIVPFQTKPFVSQTSQ